jgi:predicted DCC family thiol-disulfide oxidoreductase YuxK
VLVWYLWACLYGRNPLIANPGLPYVGWLLLAHALAPPAPYGSLAACGRVDPRGGWFLPRRLWVGAWVVMAVGYGYSGLTKLDSPSWLDGSALARVLENPLARPGAAGELARALPDALLAAAAWGGLAAEILFPLLALFARTRPWIWLALLAMHLGLVVLVDFADLSLGMIALHLFTFDPRWLPPAGEGVDAVFYDGNCGACHRAVRFALAEDASGAAFAFAPLGGPTFAAAFAPHERAALPDSIVVRTTDGRVLVRSRAVVRMLERCGGAWRALAVLLRLVPRPLCDRAYDAFAAIRHRVFARPSEACPLMPRELGARFRA